MLEQRYFSTGDDTRFKIIMVGDSNVGKTTLFWKYIQGEYLKQKSQSVTTIDFKIKEIKIQNQPIKLYIWDTAGQQKYKSIVSTYFKGCDGVIIMFDLTKPSSYQNAITKWYQLSMSKAHDAQMMLIGNKSDLPRMVEQNQAMTWAHQHNIRYIQTSVKENLNVDQCYDILSNQIFKNLKIRRSTGTVLRSKSLADNKSKKNCAC